MKLKERTTRVFVSSMLSLCMVFSVMPNIPVKAAKEEDSIQRLVCSYMDSREMAVTEGDAGNLENVAVCGIVDDEAVHRSVLAKSGISISDTSFKIMDIDIYDTMTTVSLSESIEYVTDGVAASTDVEHSLTIMYDEDGTAKVVSDKYTELPTGFQSCSYISGEEEEDAGIALLTSDLRSELIAVAGDEVGYKEKKSNSNLDDFTANAGNKNYTKYGQWYGSNPAPWCAIFVSWCAYMTEISTDIIPKYENCTTGMDTFKNRGCFYYSSANGGSYTPKIGDIFFTGTSKTSSSHTGIVTGVSSSQITVISGNYSDMVAEHTYKLTDSSLVGFASPNY